MRVFELVGPIMFGPSSSHTAGACRLSRAMWQILDCPMKKAALGLHGSFRVHEGGTVNKALVAGLLGFDTDDDRINNSHALMEQSGIDFSWENVTLENAHNNSVRYEIEGDGFSFIAIGASVGGGMIEVSEINGIKLSLTGDYNTLLVFAEDLEKAEKAFSSLGLEGGEVECHPGKAGGGIILYKTSLPLEPELCQKLESREGVGHASRHLRFD